MPLATHATDPAAVPIEQEPAHRLVLQNERVRVFEVLLPPGKDSLWHVHRHDGSSVRLADATVEDEPLDGPPRTFHLVTGDVSFGATPTAMTHRVRNTGATAFHNIYIELLAGPGPGASRAAAAVSTDPRIVLENDRVRALRRVLPPGAATGIHTHASNAVAVLITAGRLEVVNASGITQTNEVKPGAVQWLEAGTTHALRNVGDRSIEIVDVELK